MKNFFIALFVLTSVAGFAQDVNEKLPWQEAYRLQWDDFKATPDNANPFDASTSSGLSYSFTYADTPDGLVDFRFFVGSNFYPNKSWTKNRDASNALLEHEQLHFDISELHARILKQMLMNYQPNRNVEEDLKKMYESAEIKRQEMQERFDEETDHGLKKEESLRWKIFIASELLKYKEYSS